MKNTPHELTEAFPDHVELIRKLKADNTHFSKLADQYHEVNREVHRGETDVEPMSDERMIELRKRRLQLLDEISGMLRAAESAS